MANIYSMNSASYNQATSSPLAISKLVRKDSSKRPKLSLSAKKQKQTCLWGWTLKDSTTLTPTCTSPAQDTVKSDHTATTANESFESVQDTKESDNATVVNDNKELSQTRMRTTL